MIAMLYDTSSDGVYESVAPRGRINLVRFLNNNRRTSAGSSDICLQSCNYTHTDQAPILINPIGLVGQ